MSQHPLYQCRSCGSTQISEIVSLGQMPLANALLKEEQLQYPELLYPLDLVFCHQCTLVQITETIPPEQLFSNYLYFSSVSDTVLENAKTIAEHLIATRHLNNTSLVAEIASNDGYLLKNYKSHNISVLGIEPAQNIAHVAEMNGISTLSEFFNNTVAQRLVSEGKQADVIHANNVIAHVADLHGVTAGIATLLKPDGVAVIENHYVKDLIDHTEFDSIYHEHLCYYSVTSFQKLFRQHNLVLVDAERLPIHGGSIRVFFQRADGPCSMAREGAIRAKRLLEEETAWGGTGKTGIGFSITFVNNRGQKDCRLWGVCKEHHSAELLWDRIRYTQLCCRQGAGEAGTLYARNPSSHLSTGTIAENSTGLCAPARVEFCRRGTASAG
jgi:SAM-dependent methyltransferase